jgi:secreted Zn-dependent insulinase-like peptidase
MFINTVKKEGFQQYFADEITKIGRIKSQFKSTNNTTEEKVVCYSNLLHTQSSDDLVNYWHPTKPLIKTLIVDSFSCLCPQNMDIFIIGKKFESDANKVEKHIDVRYSSNIIPDYLINKWNKILPTSEKLGHPPQNIYIPNELPTIPSIADDPVPHLVFKNDRMICYSRPECNFSTPFAKIAINIKTSDSLLSSSAFKISFLYVWQTFMQEYLAEDTYLAKLAGNSFKFGFNKKSPTKFLSELCLIINSYTNTVSSLLIDFITKIKECPYRNLEGLFFNCYNKVNYELKSIQYRTPIMQSFLILKPLIFHNEFSVEDILQALSKLTFAIFIEICDEWLKKCHFNWFIIGNLNDALIINLINKVSSIINYEPLPFWSYKPSGVAKLSPSKQYSYTKVAPINNEISSLLHYVQCDSKYSCAYIYLAIQMIKPEYYNQLRTKKKLAYSVDCESIQLIDTYALAFLITSDENKPEQLIQYNIDFFDFIIQKINETTDSEFSHMVEVAIQHFSQNDSNLKQQFLKYYNMASIYDFTFSKYTELVKALQLMKRSEFQQFISDFLGPNCRQVCIQLMNSSYAKENKEHEMNTILKAKAHGWIREEIPYVRLLSAATECYNDAKLMRLYNYI